jgi:hypothetical protein
MNALAGWTAKSEIVHNGHRYLIFRDEEPVPFRSYLYALEQDADFRRWYSDLLGGSEFDAFFWEHPPLCMANIGSQAEFVLLDSPTLAAFGADTESFKSYFRDGNGIVSFPSLGGDAVLIAPTPSKPVAACTHLASFVRNAPSVQVEALWRETGRMVRESLSDRNLWVSTSGLGVSWLHIRLDSFPKYYQHRPYRETHGAFGLR